MDQFWVASASRQFFSELHWVEIMLDQSSWHAIAVGGLVLSAIAGLTSGPMAAAAFTVLYGAAVLSILRIM